MAKNGIGLTEKVSSGGNAPRRPLKGHRRRRLERGFVQVYTGDGKGKTTAALGLALRAAGAGLRVWIGQFIKGMKYSELRALARHRGAIEVHQFGRGCFIRSAPTETDIECARRGLVEARRILEEGRHDVVILDEANIAAKLGLISAEDLCSLIDARPDGVELVLTGRSAPKEVLEKADLVTEMREVRHYYRRGVMARTGIEK